MKVGLLGRRRSLEVAEAGFQDWIDRVLALTGLGTGVVSVLLATGQAAHLNRVWLVTIAGALLVASALLPVYAWTRRGLALPASLYGPVRRDRRGGPVDVAAGLERAGRAG